jgi:hypothetical protein
MCVCVQLLKLLPLTNTNKNQFPPKKVASKKEDIHEYYNRDRALPRVILVTIRPLAVESGLVD